MSEIKKRYKEFAKVESLPLYLQPWWLDAVTPNSNLQWDVMLYEKGDNILASFVYCYKVKLNKKIIAMPSFTAFTGLFIKYSQNKKMHKKLSLDKKIMSDFIQRLPKFDKFVMHLTPNITNWLPFYWEGFNETTRYTYIIDNLSNLDEVHSNFDQMAKRNIKKAQKNNIEVVESDDISAFYEINKITFQNQNVDIPYTKEFLETIYNVGKKENAVKMLFAKKENKIYSVMLSFIDDNFVYIIANGSDRNINTYGAEYLLFWEMMKYASENNLSFDFEGSMIDGVERRNRVFGAKQYRYFKISKCNSKLLKFVDILRGTR